MLKRPLILLTILFLFQSCGGSGGSPSGGNGEDSGNGQFTPDGPAREDYIVPSPPDPLSNYLWHLDNKGLKYYTAISNDAGEDINHKTARDNAWTGHGVLVAVSDNGTETSHPDLISNIDPQYERNYSSDNPGAWKTSATPSGSDSAAAHGTAVAGLIAATDGNGFGGMGVASRSTLGIFKYVGTGGSLNKAIDQANGPFDIFNYSYGRSSCVFIDLPQSLIDQFKYGVENLRSGKGAIYVKAAGNEYISGLDDCVDGAQGNYYGNANLEEEHSYPYLIVVGAFNAEGLSSSYSTPGSSLWIVAPGGEFGVDRAAIITTDLAGCGNGMAATDTSYTDFDKGVPENSNCDYTNTMNGSSAATPIISGVAALILEANPHLTWREVKHIMAKTARKLDPNRQSTPHPQGANLQGHTYQDGWLTNSAGYHFHNWYGFGAIDASAAVALAQSYGPPLPSFEETNWIHSRSGLSLNIPDSTSTGVSDTQYVNTEITIEAVQVKITIDHTYTGDLGVELTSPSGMKSILMNINSNILETNLSDALLLSNAFYGESSKGNWTLKIIDGAPADTGVLKGWKLNFFGHTRQNGNLLTKSMSSSNPGDSKTTSVENNVTQDKTVTINTVGTGINKTATSSSSSSSSSVKTIKYEFSLKFISEIKNKSAIGQSTLDHVIDENGKIISLVKNENGTFLADLPIPGGIKIPWYESPTKLAIQTSVGITVGSRKYPLFETSFDYYPNSSNGFLFTVDNKKMTLNDDGSVTTIQLPQGQNGKVTNSNNIEWNYNNGVLNLNNKQTYQLGNKFKVEKVLEYENRYYALVTETGLFKIIDLSSNDKIYEYHELSFIKDFSIEKLKIINNMIYMLISRDGKKEFTGIEVNEE